LCLTGILPVGSDLGRLLERRLEWELWSEYTFDCRIGRTLEKTSSSTVRVNAARAEAVVTALLENLREKVGPLRDVERLAVERFLAGLIQHLKNRGAVGQRDLDAYIENLGAPYHLGRRSKALTRLWRPTFGHGRMPVFLTNKQGEDFQALVRAGSGSATTWYEDWLRRTLGGAAAKEADVVYRTVVSVCKQQGVMLEWAAKNAVVWGLNPEIFEVTAEVSQFRCERCGYAVSVAARDAETFAGCSCLLLECKGVLALVSNADEDYYRGLYATGDICRVFVAEHTGPMPLTLRRKALVCWA